MAKKQVFGKKAQDNKAADRRMAKVIVAKKTANNKFGYKEAIVDQDEVQDFIKANKG
ncbi:DUF4295 domain-containing protein [Fodinibius sediminis]|uniref:DUF4295 domain-containing protein n=1 Tax=Fodinibius sediminis TaxID=1214077 RepID=A0A521BEK6_9BACT|nr:DUF4295 domain-containing protein [Fodinibius sediminis]SMO45514.1 hypothetical protein SAMN06265218_10351 [Fodinibius sediminis]